MRTSKLLPVLPIALGCCVYVLPVLAQTTDTTAVNLPRVSNAQAKLDSLLIVYETKADVITEVTGQFQRSLLEALGLFALIFVSVIGANMFANYRMSQRDRSQLKSENEREIEKQITALTEQIEEKVETLDELFDQKVKGQVKGQLLEPFEMTKTELAGCIREFQKDIEKRQQWKIRPWPKALALEFDQMIRATGVFGHGEKQILAFLKPPRDN